MQQQNRILTLCGSTAKLSICHTMLNFIRRHYCQDAEVMAYRRKDLPFYHSQLRIEDYDSLQVLWKRLAAADAVLMVTPSHHEGIPAYLKNIIDCGTLLKAGNCWYNKPVAVLAMSTEMQNSDAALQQLIRLLQVVGAEVVAYPRVNVTKAGLLFTENGDLTDRTLKQSIQRLVNNLVATVQQKRQQQRHVKVPEHMMATLLDY